jgi:hypothetical protein
MKLLSLLLLILLCIGCQYSPYAEDLTISQPKRNHVLGTYKFEKETVIGNLVHDLTRKSALTINSDGTFEAVDLPNFIFDNYHGNISAKGKWKIETVGSVSKWEDTASNWGLQLTSLPDNLRSMSFMGDKPPYKLLVTYGDPDGGAVMILAKD